MLRFDPFNDLDALTRGLLTSQTGSTRTPRFMPMDLCKIDDHYVLTADLPGVDPGSVDVNVDNGTLTISAHRSARNRQTARQVTHTGDRETDDPPRHAARRPSTDAARASGGVSFGTHRPFW